MMCIDRQSLLLLSPGQAGRGGVWAGSREWERGKGQAGKQSKPGEQAGEAVAGGAVSSLRSGL